MAWIADARLAAAVSNAGALGLISSINAGTEAVRAEIRKARELTQKPFGVNIMLMSPFADEVADVLHDGRGLVALLEDELAAAEDRGGDDGDLVSQFAQAFCQGGMDVTVFADQEDFHIWFRVYSLEMK